MFIFSNHQPPTNNYLIVGLGNIGEKYLNTRHNLGFLVVDYLAKDLKQENGWIENKKLNSHLIVYQQPETNYRLILAKPTTMMNDSGDAVVKLVNFYKLSAQNLMVIYDELDLPFGKIKVRSGGGSAGHHGVESIIQKLGTDQFIRVRVGIGNQKTLAGGRGGHKFDGAGYVLSEFEVDEQSKLKHILKSSIKAIESIINDGFATAHKLYN